MTFVYVYQTITFTFSNYFTTFIAFDKVFNSKSLHCTQSKLNLPSFFSFLASYSKSGWDSASTGIHTSLMFAFKPSSNKLNTPPFLLPTFTVFILSVYLIFAYIYYKITISFFHATFSQTARGSSKYWIIGLSTSNFTKYSIIWSLSKGVLGFSSSYFLVSGVYRVSAAHDNPIEKASFAPALLIASYTIFKLSIIVSRGQTNVPSGDSFKAASPPLPLTIFFLTACSTFWARYGSLTSFPMIMYLKTLHFDPIAFPPCRQLTTKSTQLLDFI